MKMDSGNGATWFMLFMVASLLAACQARTIVVGGSEGWRFGFNYTDWAIQNSPFYINDKLGPYQQPNLGWQSYVVPKFTVTLWSH